MVFRRAAALITAITIVCSFTVKASALDKYGFVDIRYNEYRDEIEWLRQEGVTNGIGANTYGPDIKINQGSFLVMISRKLYSETIDRIMNADGEYRDKVNNLAKALWSMGYDDYSLTVNNLITLDEAGQIAFRLAGIPVYGQNLYDGKTEESKNPGYDQLVRLGIVENTTDPNQIVDRDLAAHIIYTILYTDIDVEMPEILDKYNFDIEISSVDTDILVEKFNKIPDELKDVIANEGWKIVIGTNYINQWSAENGMIASGLCSYSTKTIYLANIGSMIHEMGHVLDSHLNYPIEIDRLYTVEKEGLSKLTGNYCKTNSREYFAELIEYYINNRNDREAIAKLMSIAPQSYTYIKNLESNSWSI